MAQMRSISQLYDEIKRMDPDTALSKTAIRRLVTSGRIPSVRIGQKYLVALEAVEAYLSGQIMAEAPAPEFGEVRPVGQRTGVRWHG